MFIYNDFKINVYKGMRYSSDLTQLSQLSIFYKDELILEQWYPLSLSEEEIMSIGLSYVEAI